MKFQNLSNDMFSSISLELEYNPKYIRDAAYFLWLNEGCPEGKDLDFWCQAERQIVGVTEKEAYEGLVEVQCEIRFPKNASKRRDNVVSKENCD